MRRTIAACVWVVLAAMAGPGYGLTMTGRVIDSQARPVAGAEVIVCEQHEGIWQDAEAQTIAPVIRTDTEGRFQLQAQVTEENDAFVVTRKAGHAYAWDGLNYSLNTRDKAEFLLVLEPPCVLSGRVVDPNGKPVAEARVQAVPVTSYLERLRQRPIVGPKEWFTTTTDSQGTFRFEQFAADVGATFRVQAPGRVSPCLFRPQRMHACGFEVWRSDIRLMLPREGAVKGIVQDRLGRPVAGVELLLHPGRNENTVVSSPARTTRSNAQGTFLFEGVPQGAYRIDLAAAEQGPDPWVTEGIDVSVPAGRVTEGALIRVKEGGILVLTVLAAPTRRPVAGVRVGISQQKWTRSRLTVTDAQGIARIRVPGGVHHVYFGFKGFSEWDSNVEVEEGQTLEQEALLTPLPRVSGRVLDPANRPVAQAAIVIHSFGDQVTTDAEGRFDAACNGRAAPGGYVMARDITRGLAAMVPIKNVSPPLEVKLSPGWTLTGKIVDPNGQGIPAARVWPRVDAGGGFSDAGVEALTDREGRFDVAALPPVQDGFAYRLSAAAPGYGPREHMRISPSGPGGATVDIGVIELPPARESVSGVVVDANGAPARWVPVLVNALAGVSQPSKATATNEQGEFTITRLCRGRIRLQASFSSWPGGAGSLETLAPARDLRIVLGKTLTQTPLVSLQGKPLPDLKELGLSSTEVNDKPVLLCFCDIDQRPSRRCLSELASRSDNLAAQGVTLLAAQVSKIDMSKYQTWLKDNRIAVPIHVFEGDFQARKTAWGIGALPWLILADKDRIVRAEGFGLDELQNKIETITKERRTAVCLVKGPQGARLARESVIVHPMGTKHQTDADGRFSIQYALPTDSRGLYVHVRHKDPDLIGVAWLPRTGGDLEVVLMPAVSVQGHVIDPNGRPVVGAQVAALPMSNQYVLTDAAGAFDIAWSREWEPPNGLCLMARYVQSNLAALVDIEWQSRIVTIRPEPALMLAGVVEDEDDKPVVGVTVGISLKNHWACGTPVEPVTTDAAGRYVFRVLPQNQEYLVWARAPGYWAQTGTTGLINNRPRVAEAGRIVLRRPILTLAGTVVDVNDRPVIGIQVGSRGVGQPERTTETDAQGRFTLQGLCRGPVEIWAKLDRILYGMSKAEAGRKEVKVVVRPIQ